jgi:two-component system phosphate regulon sensor histidine kinase PhoR
VVHHVRTWLVLISVAVALVAGIACYLLLRAEPADRIVIAAAAPLAVSIAALALAVGAGLFVRSLIQHSLGELADAIRDVVRDTSRRVPSVKAAPDDPLRQLAEWVNFLAEDADRSHRALARERVLLATVADGLTQGVIAVDGEHRIELLNDAARKMLNVTSSPVGEPLIEFVRVPEVFALLDADEAAAVEIQLSGGTRALIRVARKFEHEGRVLLLEDVTTMRRLENVRRDFVANVSHELRTPVAIIRANAETLLAGAKDDPVMAGKLIDGLHRNSERLARILTDLLDLSRLDAGQYRLELDDVPVGAAIEQSLTVLETNAAKRGVHVEVDAPEALAVRADPKALDQILVNLIDNAVKYTRPEGHVWIEARAEARADARDGDGAVRIEVRDDGPGIADKHRERVFERFYRADPSRSREAGGTGLGLSIVKHLVESMDGEVGVDPHDPSGSIFWLRLPAAGSMAP